MNRTLKTGFFFLLAVMGAVLVSACASVDEIDSSETVGKTEQSLTVAEKYARVMNECSQAMTGSWWTYNSTNWPLGSGSPQQAFANYAYTNSDIGAWNLLLASSNYSGYGYQSFYVSCMRRRSEGHLPSPYGYCDHSESTGYGSYEMPYFTCQGSCPSSRMRGGQCKPFMNLVAYRSGIYQGANYAFKAFPSDHTIDPSKDVKNPGPARSATDPNMPLATYANIVEGDFLRQPFGHAAIVVRKISSSQIIIFDSNWVGGGDGYEIVGSHPMTASALSSYRVLKCVYTGAC